MLEVQTKYENLTNVSFSWQYKRWVSDTEWKSGNKWFKLYYNLLDAQQKGFTELVTLGGPWSNHLLATSECGPIEGFKCHGVIRGSWQMENPTTSMQQMMHNGMSLRAVDTELYDLRGSEDFKVWLHDHYPNAYYIPEGGANYLGLMGCMEMLSSDDLTNFTDFAVAGGTGTTAAGLLLKTNSNHKVHVFFALKADYGELKEMVRGQLRWVIQERDIQDEYLDRLVIYSDQRWGGYGKIKDELVHWIQSEMEQGRKWDRVYTAKMMYALQHEASEALMQAKLLMIHTGGLQGNASLSPAYP
jgi:1-aminocyclopropane-1-carboxylate deaminase